MTSTSHFLKKHVLRGLARASAALVTAIASADYGLALKMFFVTPEGGWLVPGPDRRGGRCSGDARPNHGCDNRPVAASRCRMVQG